MRNEFIEMLLRRRSVRKYQKKQISEEELRTILEVGTYAPCGRGLQAAIMVAVQDPETIDTLRRMNAEIMGTPDHDPFYGAPTVVVVLADRSIRTYLEDGSLVMGNLMHAANAIGVDSCWIHRAREEFESEEGKALLRKWGIQGDYCGIGHCLLGYAEGERPVAKPRKENYIYYVR